MNLLSLLAHVGFTTDTKPLEGVERALEGIKKRIETIVEFEIAKKAFEMAEGFARWGENLKITSENIGVSVEQMQQLSYAAGRSGVSTEEMSQGLARLSRHLYDARTGGTEAMKAFNKIGISSEQVASFKSADEALYVMADRIQSIQDPIKRMAVAQELFGRGGYQMISFLAKGSAEIKRLGREVKELGLVLSGPQVEALEETHHALERIHAIFRAVGAQIAANFAPILTYAVEKIVEFYKASKDIINVNIHNFLMSFAWGLGFVAGLLVSAGKRVVEFADKLGMKGQIAKLIAGFLGLVAVGTVLGAIFGVLSFALAPLIALLGAIFSSAGLVVAIFAGLAVVVHDLYTSFEGGDSWSSMFADWAKSLGPVKWAIEFLSAAFEKMSADFNDWVDSSETLSSIASALNAMGRGVGWVYDMAKAFGSWVLALQPVQDMLTSISDFFSGTVGGALSKAMDYLSSVASISAAKANEAVALGSPEAAMASAGVGSTTSNTSSQAVSMINHVTVNVPAGTDPKDASQAIETGFHKEFGTIRRQLGRSVGSTVGY